MEYVLLKETRLELTWIVLYDRFQPGLYILSPFSSVCRFIGVTKIINFEAHSFNWLSQSSLALLFLIDRIFKVGFPINILRVLLLCHSMMLSTIILFDILLLRASL